MAEVKPLFKFDDPPPIQKRLVLRFPKDGKKPHFRVNIMNIRKPELRFNMVVAIDTGAPYSTFPEMLTEPLQVDH